MSELMEQLRDVALFNYTKLTQDTLEDFLFELSKIPVKKNRNFNFLCGFITNILFNLEVGNYSHEFKLYMRNKIDIYNRLRRLGTFVEIRKHHISVGYSAESIENIDNRLDRIQKLVFDKYRNIEDKWKESCNERY